MTILDELLEKKDLRLYILTLIKRLQLTLDDELMTLPPERRQYVKERFVGRMMELHHLKQLLDHDLIKEKCKINWEKVGGLNYEY